MNIGFNIHKCRKWFFGCLNTEVFNDKKSWTNSNDENIPNIFKKYQTVIKTQVETYSAGFESIAAFLIHLFGHSNKRFRINGQTAYEATDVCSSVLFILWQKEFFFFDVRIFIEMWFSHTSAVFITIFIVVLSAVCLVSKVEP